MTIAPLTSGASRLLPTFKHVHNITDFPKSLGHARGHCGAHFERLAFRHVHAASTRFGHSSVAGYRLLFRKINRLCEGLILKRVVKRHLLGARIRENAAKTRGEGVVRTIIGPESERGADVRQAGRAPARR